VNIFKIEEHHEAFIIWCYLIKRKSIPEKDNILFHVDHHADMGCPVLDRSVNDILLNNIEDIKSFTYSNLRISDFIIPAIYQNFFNEFYWLQRIYSGKNTAKDHYVKSNKREGKVFVDLVDDSAWKRFTPDDGRVLYKNTQLNPENVISIKKEVILDIDLDYFSSHRARLTENRLEITEKEFKNIKENKYHFLNNEYKYKLISENKRFFVKFYHGLESEEKAHLTSKTEIEKRVNRFFDYIKDNNISFSNVILCRSRFSNYTPANQWNFIEDLLTKRFKKINNSDILTIEDIK